MPEQEPTERAGKSCFVACPPDRPCECRDRMLREQQSTDWRQWPVSELVDYLESAAEDGVLIYGAMLNKLARLDPKGPGVPLPESTYYEVAPHRIAPAIARIREKMKLTA